MTARPLNYTTTIDVRRTVGEVQQLLAEHGATSVQITYRDSIAVGVGFTLTGPHGDRSFSLPVRVDAVHAQLNSPDVTASLRRLKQAGAPGKYQTRQQAARVAWRTVQDWLEAQLAMVAAEMVALDEVMLPYLHVDAAGRTLYAAYVDREQAAQLVGGDGGKA